MGETKRVRVAANDWAPSGVRRFERVGEPATRTSKLRVSWSEGGPEELERGWWWMNVTEMQFRVEGLCISKDHGWRGPYGTEKEAWEASS